MSSKGIADIKAKSRPFLLEVRVIRKYIPYVSTGESKDVYYLLIDASGTAIEAQADRKDSKIAALIKVGNCYTVNGHICTVQRPSGRVVDHPASIVIVPRTEITPIADRDIPKFYFDFAPYSELAQRLADNNVLLTDFIGRVQSATGVIRRQGRSLLKITLIEPGGQDIVLTLWQEIALSFTQENVIGKMLAVGSAKVTRYLGQLQLESTDVTVTYIDPPLQNLTDISNSIQALQPRAINLTRLQQMESHAEIGCTLADLRSKETDQYKNKLYKCKATMKEFEAYRGWFITRCPHPGCNKNLYEEMSDDESEYTKPPSLICRAGHSVESPDYQYSVNGLIMDDTAFLPVVIFNEAMAVAMETPCRDLVVDHGFNDAKKIPEPLLALVGVEANYTLRMRNNNSATVECITKLNNEPKPSTMQLITSPVKPHTPAKKASRKVNASPTDEELSSPKKLKGKAVSDP